MPVFSHKDSGFQKDAHSTLGQRLFTISHSKRDGIILTAVALPLVLIAAILFVWSKQTEIYLIYGVLIAFLALLLAGAGIGKLFQSRAVIHVYENGILKLAGGKTFGMFYKRVSHCDLDYYTKGITTGIRLILSNGKIDIVIGDGMGIWDFKSKNKYTAMINQIVSIIPDSVKVKGFHAKVQACLSDDDAQ